MATFFAALAPELPAEGAAGPVGWVVFGVSLAIAALAQLFSGPFGGTDWNAVNASLTKMRATLTEVADATARFAWDVAYALGKLLQMLEQAFIGFFEYMWELIKRLWKYIEKIVTAVLPQLAQAIHKAKDWIQKIYHDYLRPILHWIQVARQYLLILRILHLKIATRLDGILSSIQSRAFGPIYWLLSTLNTYGGWINTVLAYDYTIQKPIFLRSMYKYQGDWVGMWWNAQFDTSSQPAGVGQVQAAVPPTIPETAATLQGQVAAGNTAFPPEVQAAAGQLSAWVTVS